MPVLPKLYQNIEEEGTLPKLFSEASVTLIPEPDKGTTRKKKNYRLVSLMNTHVKILDKLKITEFTNTLKGSHPVIKWDLFQR